MQQSVVQAAESPVSLDLPLHPLPDADRPDDDLLDVRPMSEPGEPRSVVGVVDRDSKVVQSVGGLDMRPGTVLEVMEKHPFGGPLTLGFDSVVYSVGRELSGYVFVETYGSG